MKAQNYSTASILTILFALNATAGTFYVDLNSPGPTPPYSSWATAAHAIQDALAAATNGDTILVTNGLYNTGAYSRIGLNRILVTNAVTVRSVNGPAVTTIQGYQLPGVTNGVGAIRCAYLTNGACLSGFTLTNGATSDLWSDREGGGVYCQGSSAVVSNCVLSGNAATGSGGGVCGGTLQNCVISRNQASLGGGSYAASLINCVLVRNFASVAGGGDAYSALYNCTITDNVAGSLGGGACQSLPINCILCYDYAPENPEWGPGLYAYMVNCCCPQLSGDAYYCFAFEPGFVNRAAGDYRLQATSPCINAGNNLFVTNNVDRDGNPRIVGGTVDVGAYEYQSPISALSYAWARNHNVSISGLADYADPDHDGSSNWHEWQAETDPWNAASVFKLSQRVGNASGITLSWNGIYGRWYHLDRSTNLSANPAFTTIITNIFGSWETTTSVTDTQATNAGPYFYRVVLEPQTAFGVVY